MERADVSAYNRAKKFVSPGGIIEGLIENAARHSDLLCMH